MIALSIIIIIIAYLFGCVYTSIVIIREIADNYLSLSPTQAEELCVYIISSWFGLITFLHKNL